MSKIAQVLASQGKLPAATGKTPVAQGAFQTPKVIENFRPQILRPQQSTKISQIRNTFDPIDTDKIQSELAKGSEAVKGLYGGWNSPSDLAAKKVTVNNTLSALKRYKNYLQKGGDVKNVSAIAGLNVEWDDIEGTTQRDRILNRGSVSKYVQNKVNTPAINSVNDLIRDYENVLTDWDDIESKYSHFQTREEYDAALAESEKIKTYDTVQARKDVEALKAKRDVVVRLKNSPGIKNPAVASTLTEDVKNTLGEYSSLDDLEKDISEREAYINRAEYIQGGLKLSSVSDPSSENYDPNFKRYAKAGRSLALSQNLGKTQSEYANMGIGGSTGNSSVVKLDELAAAVLALREKEGEDISAERTKIKNYSLVDDYRYMTDKELDTLAYYIYVDSINGTDSASKYAESILDSVRSVRAREIADKYSGNILGQLGYGAYAGLEGFGTGLKNLVEQKEGYIPATTTQRVSSEINSDLADKSFPMWYNFKEGKWENDIAGRSAGQIAYESINTTARMLPTVLASAVMDKVLPGSGKYVGTALIGASSAGAAYEEMINLGYSKEQANNYALLTGSSEALLQYFLGGISSLGGTKKYIENFTKGLNNALAVASIQLAGTSASEFFEEALQVVLEPYLENLALGYDKNNWSDVQWSEALYSGFLGALTSLGFEGIPTVAKVNSDSKLGKYLTEGDTEGENVSAIIEEGLASAPNTDAHFIAEKADERLKTGKGVSNNLIGRLYRANVEAVNGEKNTASESETEGSKYTVDKSPALLQRGEDMTESPEERAKRYQPFSLDVLPTNPLALETVESAVDSGFNNTAETHSLVDAASKLSAGMGKPIVFVNSNMLTAQGFTLPGKIVNGVHLPDRILINTDSPKPFNLTVGHEMTHEMEKGGLYQKLHDAVQSYSIQIGEYDAKLKEVTELYRGKKDADIDKELTAELCSEYLFKDTSFIESLTQDKDLFDRIYDAIKHMITLVTAGSPEARMLEKVKYNFERAYRSNRIQNSDVKNKFSVSNSSVDSEGLELTEEQKEYFKDSVVRDEDGNLIPVYHGTRMGGFSVFSKGVGYFFTDDANMAESYSGVRDITSFATRTWKEALELAKKLGLSSMYNKYQDTYYIYGGRYDARDWKGSELPEFVEFLKSKIGNSIPSRATNYKAYLNLKNPLIINGNGNNFKTVKNHDENGNPISEAKSTEDWAKEAKAQNYDGVIFKNIYDVGHLGVFSGYDYPVNVYVAFKPNQIKFTGNVAPTTDEDIRYSASSEDGESSYSDNKIEEFDFSEAAPFGVTTTTPVLGLKTGEEIVAEERAKAEDGKSMYEKIKEAREKELASLVGIRDSRNSVFTQEMNELIASRNATEKAFDDEIARLESELAKSRNPEKTKKGTTLRQRIARLKIRKAQRLSEADSRIAKARGTYETQTPKIDKRVARAADRVNKLSKKEITRRETAKRKSQEYRDFWKNLIGTTTNWQDKKTGLQYELNTLRRNLQDIVRDENGKPDLAKADAIYEALQGSYNKNEAEMKRESARIKKIFADLKLTDAESAYTQMLGEYKYNPETILTREQLHDFFEAHKDEIDVEKVNNTIKLARDMYDELYERVNAVLRAQGMKEIPYREGYFPHFAENKPSIWAKIFNWKTPNNEIPTDIAGLTEGFNPTKSYQSFDKRRRGETTDYNFLKGFEGYLAGALDWIYHIEDLQRRRSLEDYIRYEHSDKALQEKIDEIKSQGLDPEEENALIRVAVGEREHKLGNFLTTFRAQTNVLAGKKHSNDRGIEELTNRTISYTLATNVSSRINANMIAANVTSALTNFIPITQSWAEVSPLSTLKGALDTIKASMAHDDTVISKSDFLANRLTREERLVQTKWDKVIDKAGFLMEVIDSFASETIWRSRYYENINSGMSEEESVKDADNFCAGIMASRSRGDMPGLFDRKNIAWKIFTSFQLEVNNQYGYVTKDLPRNIRERTKTKAGTVVKLAWGLTKMFFGAYIFNNLYQLIAGRRPALDPIGIIKELVNDVSDDEKDWSDIYTWVDTGKEFGTDVLEQVPFVGGLMGGGRIPLASAFPDFGNVIKGGREMAWELAKPVAYLGLPAAGGQIYKTAKGIETVARGGSYKTDKEGNELLQYPYYSDEGVGSVVRAGQAAVFGKNSIPTATDWVENDFDTLNASQTAAYRGMIDAGDGQRESFEFIKSLRDIEGENERLSALYNSDFSDEAKYAAYYNMFASRNDKTPNKDERYAILDKLENKSAINAILKIKTADPKAKAQALASSDLSLNDKKLIFREYVNRQAYNEAVNLAHKGIGYSEYFNAYAELEKIKQVEKDSLVQKTEFAHWLNNNSESMTDTERASLREALIGEGETSYDKLVNGGVSDENAYLLGLEIDALKAPVLDGHTTVQTYQKYRAVIDAEMSQEETVSAIKALSSESQCKKIDRLVNSRVDIKFYVELAELIGASGKSISSVSNSELKTFINRMAAPALGLDSPMTWPTIKKKLYEALTSNVKSSGNSSGYSRIQDVINKKGK